MKKETLLKGQELLEKIEEAQKNLKSAKYMTYDDINPRCSYLNFLGVNEKIEIPETLWRVLGRMLVSEFNQQIFELQKELDEL